MATIESNRELVKGLWPNARWGGPGSTLATAYKQSFDALNQATLEQAIKEVKRRYSTWANNPPELRWFLTEYGRLRNEAGAQARYTASGVEALAEVEREREAQVEFLRAQGRDIIASAISELRERKWIGADPLPSDVSRWRVGTRGIVAAWIRNKAGAAQCQHHDSASGSNS